MTEAGLSPEEIKEIGRKVVDRDDLLVFFRTQIESLLSFVTSVKSFYHPLIEFFWLLMRVPMQTHWSSAEVKKRYEYFQAHTEGSEMTKNEFCSYFSTQLRGAGRDQLTRLFRSADTDKNRSLSFAETAQLMYVFEKGSSEERLDVMWRMFDSENAGYLLDTDEQFLVEHMMRVAQILGKETRSATSYIEKVLLQRLKTKTEMRVSKERWMKEGAKLPSFLLFLGFQEHRSAS
jgi:Ca2+-binding EF-hand superfamily protein